MDYKVFYRKYRPKNFNELIGQDNIKEILTNSIKLNKIAHAYIFTGPRGTGKTSTAKIFAKTLNCLDNSNGISCDKCERCLEYNESADIIEIDAASNNGVEEIRALRDSVKVAPYNSKYKIYIIDEVHMLSNSAWNAFLKTLEEPPSHVVFIMATTDINKVPETVMSRCQRFDFSKIPSEIMFEHLKKIASLEKIKIEDEALNELIKYSDGCLRDALSYLDQVSKFNTKVSVDLVEKCFGILSNNTMALLYDKVIANDKYEINKIIDEINKSGVTPLNFINYFIEFLLDKMLVEKSTNSQILKKLINSLNGVLLQTNSIVNPYTIIKVELIAFNSNNKEENISREIFSNEHKKQEIIMDIKKTDNIEAKDEDILNEIPEMEDQSDLIEIKKIRINNSFYKASKQLKNEIMENWKKFIENLTINKNFSILGNVENMNIEVVSETNILFSTENENEALLFNSKKEEIEREYNTLYNSNYKFIALTKKEWLEEKDRFIKNKVRNFEYIEEKTEENKSVNNAGQNLATEIFGSDIIEIR